MKKDAYNDCMKKRDIVHYISTSYGIPEAQAELAFNVVINSIKKLLINKTCVSIHGFGAFIPSKRKKTTFTGKNAHLSFGEDKFGIKFVVSQSIKRELNKSTKRG